MKEVTCPFCDHRQKTRSKLERVTCSNCGNKFYKETKNVIQESNDPVKENSPVSSNDLEPPINNKGVPKKVKLD